MSIEKLSKRRQVDTVRNDPGWDDTLPAGPTLEEGDSDADDTNALASQIRRIIHGPAPSSLERWHDLPPAGLVDIASVGTSYVAGEALLIGDALAIASSGQAVKASRIPALQLYHVVGLALNDALPGGAVAVCRIGATAQARFSGAVPATLNGRPVWLAENGQATMEAASTPPAADFQLGILTGADGLTSTPEVLFSPILSALFF